MKLNDWLIENQKSKADFATDVEVCRDTVYRWVRGTKPSKYTIRRIEKLTDGKVKADEWNN